MSTTTPALLSVLFAVLNEHQATLCVRGYCQKSQLLTVIRHDHEHGAKDYAIAGDDTLMSLPVNDGETLILFVQDRDTIIASGIYQVDLGMAEELGAVLTPKSSANLLLDQCDATIIDHGLTATLDSVDAALKAATETAVAQ